MGKLVASLAEARNHQIVDVLEEADVCIDFSVAKAVLDHVTQACAAKVPIVIGTTGWEESLPLAHKLVAESENGALYAPNFAIGIALFRKLLIQAQNLYADYALSGEETHHTEKKDAPSGTAKAIAHDLKMESPFSSQREGAVVGKHEVVFDSPIDTISLKHEAKNREGFALGAIQAAEWICNQKGWFTLDDMLHSTNHSV